MLNEILYIFLNPDENLNVSINFDDEILLSISKSIAKPSVSYFEA